MKGQLLKVYFILFILQGMLPLAKAQFADTGANSQSLESAYIQAFVEAIAYQQTDLLCYSYSMTDLSVRSTAESISDILDDPIQNEEADKAFMTKFFTDPQYRASIMEWVFLLHWDAFAQAGTAYPQDDGEILSLTDKYAQYVGYLVDSYGFKTAIRHCAIRNGVDPTDLENAMATSILQANRNTGIAVGVIGLLSVVILEWYSGTLIITKTIKGLAKGTQIIRGWLRPPRLPANPLGLNSPLTQPQPQAQWVLGWAANLGLGSQFTQSQQVVLQTAAQELAKRQSILNVEYSKFDILLEGSFFNYFGYQMITGMSQNREDPLEESYRPAATSLDSVEEIANRWWSSRWNDYERLIDLNLEIQRLKESNDPRLPLLTTRFYALLDFYLIDYGLIANAIESYRETIVDLERQIHELCPARSIRAKVRCRDQNRRTIYQLETELKSMQYANRFRTLRTIFPLLTFRKIQLELDLKYFESPSDLLTDIQESVYKKSLFELMKINEEREYGRCHTSLSFPEGHSVISPYGEYVEVYYTMEEKDSSEVLNAIPFCRFHWLYNKQKLSITMTTMEISELEDLTLELQQYYRDK